MAILGGIITFKSLVVESATVTATKLAHGHGNLCFSSLRPIWFSVCPLAGLPSIKLPAMGLIFGIFALTFIASNAGEEFKFKEVAILAVILEHHELCRVYLVAEIAVPRVANFPDRLITLS